MKPNVLIFSGYGFNSEEETQFAFEQSGARANMVHINDIIVRSVLKRQTAQRFDCKR